MTCALCGATFQRTEIETGFTDQKKREAAEARVHAESAEGEKWEHFQVVTTRAGGKLELLSGHLCPKENLKPGAIKIAKTA